MNSIVQKCCLLHTVGINKKVLLAALFIALSLPVFSQVGIGTTTPNAASILDLTATNKGLLLPRLANTSAISNPTNGLVIYDESEKCLKAYQNDAWSNCIDISTSPKVEALACSSAITVGTLTAGTMASGVSFTVNYTGGNGVSYAGETIASTGVTGLTATSVGATLTNASGSVTYTVSGTPNGVSSGTASFAITVGGQSCTVNLNVLEAVPTITALYCSSATLVGSLVAGTTVTGGSGFSVNYSGANGAPYGAAAINSTGITGLTATLLPGTLASGSGTLNYLISGTPSGILAGMATFEISIGGQSCSVNLNVLEAAPTITTLDCTGATIAGTLVAAEAASGVTFTVPYTGANGANYTGETVNSTGSTGLTATLLAGNLATGSGTLTYTVTGTAATVATASFAISIGGQSCSVGITVNCNAVLSPINTTIVEIISPSGQIWMDRNLGAENVGDYGDYYQWGRSNDGHQLAISCTTTGPVAAGTEGRNFVVNIFDPYNWLSTQDDTRWNSGTETNPVKTQYDPCPTGYRVPTETELTAELNNISDLGLILPGFRHFNSRINNPGITAFYWSSSTISTFGRKLSINESAIILNNTQRGIGASIRCIKE